mgnify:CR=1 FL=1
MTKILVTGGAGYIGSHTIIELVNAGYTPIIVDNLCNTSTRNIDGIEKIIGSKVIWDNTDCTDKIAMEKVFSAEGKIEGAIHFAAYKAVEESVQNPQKYYDNNLGSLKVLLQCMSENSIKNIDLAYETWVFCKLVEAIDQRFGIKDLDFNTKNEYVEFVHDGQSIFLVHET